MNTVDNHASRADVRVCADAQSVAVAAAELFVSVCAEAVAARGRFRVALSGGSTPRWTYELLASPAFAARVDWSKVDIFWSDERYVPSDDPSSNYRMTHEALLSRVPIPNVNVHRLPTELSPATTAAAAYEESIRQCFDVSSGVPRFDLIFLGLGTNGQLHHFFPIRRCCMKPAMLLRPISSLRSTCGGSP